MMPLAEVAHPLLGLLAVPLLVALGVIALVSLRIVRIRRRLPWLPLSLVLAVPPVRAAAGVAVAWIVVLVVALGLVVAATLGVVP